MAEKVKPVTPAQVVKRKQEEALPNGVIEAFNELIVKNWSGHSARVDQKDVLALIMSKMEVTRDAVFKNRWLDVEDVFARAGWDVEYDKPGWCESYEAFFVFSRRR